MNIEDIVSNLPNQVELAIRSEAIAEGRRLERERLAPLYDAIHAIYKCGLDGDIRIVSLRGDTTLFKLHKLALQLREGGK